MFRSKKDALKSASMLTKNHCLTTELRQPSPCWLGTIAFICPQLFVLDIAKGYIYRCKLYGKYRENASFMTTVGGS